jgi:hypothetical protein
LIGDPTKTNEKVVLSQWTLGQQGIRLEERFLKRSN